MRPERPVLAGNNKAAVHVLELLLEQWEPTDVLVIGPPGGRKHPWQVSLSERADELGVQTIEPTRVNDPEVIEAIVAHRCDLLLSIYYTQVFAPELLRAVAGPALNFHPSLLPRHRGTAPLIWAIVDGDEVTGLSVHELSEGIDTGDLVVQHPLPIHPDDTGYTLHEKMAGLVRATASELLRSMLTGTGLPAARPQSGTASYHSSKDPTVNQIDWTSPRRRIRDVVRALASPLPGAFTYHRGRRIGLDRVDLVDRPGPVRTSGMVDLGPDAEVHVWTGDGAVRLDVVCVDGELRQPTVLGLRDGEVLG